MITKSTVMSVTWAWSRHWGSSFRTPPSSAAGRRRSLWVFTCQDLGVLVGWYLGLGVTIHCTHVKRRDYDNENSVRYVKGLDPELASLMHRWHVNFG